MLYMAHTFGKLQKKVERFLEDHLHGLENDERVEALSWYCQGLALEIPQKSVLGMAAAMAPENMQQRRQRMQRAVTRGRFTHEDVFERLQTTIFETSAAYIDAYALDDSGIAKKGELSPGVQRQYSGTLGKVDNCQVVVSLHAVSDDFSACLGAELYLPESWVHDEVRLDKAGVPDDRRRLRTKPEIGIELLRAARANGAPRRPVVADAGYGDSNEFRDGVTELGLDFVVGVSSNTTVWPPGARPAVPKHSGQRGRPHSYEYDPKGKEPIRIDKLAAKYWRTGKFKKVRWRTGTKGPLSGKFYAVRIKSAERRTKGRRAGEDLWLLIERDESRPSKFKYYLSSLAETVSLKKLVRIAKVRWKIERDYQNLKQKLGLDRYEGRSWGGLHRHIAMGALIHAFLSIHREDFSPGGHSTLDLGGLSPCPHCGSHALERSVPDLRAAI